MKQADKAMHFGLLVAAAVTACALLILSPAYARYSNTVSTAVVYGDADAYFVRTRETLSADTAEYDFGCLDSTADRNTFTHVLRLTDVPNGDGTLYFSFDDATRTAKDVAVYIDPVYYVAEQSGSYTVTPVNGLLEIPFSLMFSATPLTADRMAVLNVSWYPAGSNEPTHFARYRMALLAAVPEGMGSPALDRDTTISLAAGLLQTAVTTPSDYAGVRLAPGTSVEGAFPASTRYFTDACPRGITLLRDSALYLPYQAEATCVILDLTATEMADPVSLTAGVSENVCHTLSLDLSDSPSLSVSLNDPAAVVSATSPLTLTIIEASVLQKDSGSLAWVIYRREGDSLLPVTVGEGLTVTADETAGTLTVAVSDDTAPAGTYLLTITQIYHGFPVCKTPIWFFIDYR